MVRYEDYSPLTDGQFSITITVTDQEIAACGRHMDLTDLLHDKMLAAWNRLYDALLPEVEKNL